MRIELGLTQIGSGCGSGSGGVGGKPGPALFLSSNTVLDNATINTVIGTFSVVGGTGSYTYTFTSNPGSLFNILTNQLRVNAALTAGTDPITVKADNGAGSVITQNFNIIVSSSAAYALKFDYSLPNNEALLVAA